MDPSIIKLLEEDEDETMHSGADVEAFIAALSRDIEALSQGSGHISSENSENKLGHLQKTGDQMVVASGQVNERTSRVPFSLLVPIIETQLEKQQAIQVQTLYDKLKKNEIPKDGFVRSLKSIVGDQMIKMAAFKLQEKVAGKSQSRHNNIPSRPQSSVQQHLHKQSITADSSNSTMGNINAQTNSDGNQITQNSSSSFSAAMQQKERPFQIPGLTKQQQQHLHFPQASFPNYRSISTNYQPFCCTSINNSLTQSLKPQPRDSQVREIMVHRSVSQLSNKLTLQRTELTNKEQKHGSISPSSVGYVKQENFDEVNEQSQKWKVEQKSANGSFTSTLPSNSSSSSITARLVTYSSLSSRIPSVNSPVKPNLGQKKPLEALGSSPSPPGKKQKVSGDFSDQSIEQLNDVAAVGGVNLREEEEQLLAGPKEDSRVSEASRRIVQEEEEMLILQRTPLQKKLAQILRKFGLKGISNEVERCLSLCVEERMRGLISNLVRRSKQRVFIEKPRHRTVITSDIGQQIIMMNKKAREEEQARKLADEEKLEIVSEREGNTGVAVNKEKDDGSGKSFKGEDEKMQTTTAANVAARAAVGGDDVSLKWQLMAEQSRRQKRGGATYSQPLKDLSPLKSMATTRDNNQETERRNHAAAAVPTPGSVRKFGSSKAVVPLTRRISNRDVIAVLEREPQTSKSTLICRLYEKPRTILAG